MAHRCMWRVRARHAVPLLWKRQMQKNDAGAFSFRYSLHLVTLAQPGLTVLLGFRLLAKAWSWAEGTGGVPGAHLYFCTGCGKLFASGAANAALRRYRGKWYEAVLV
jgi:hypothetical protein